MLLFQDKDQQ